MASGSTVYKYANSQSLRSFPVHSGLFPSERVHFFIVCPDQSASWFLLWYFSYATQTRINIYTSGWSNCCFSIKFKHSASCLKINAFRRNSVNGWSWEVQFPGAVSWTSGQRYRINYSCLIPHNLLHKGIRVKYQQSASYERKTVNWSSFWYPWQSFLDYMMNRWIHTVLTRI